MSKIHLARNMYDHRVNHITIDTEHLTSRRAEHAEMLRLMTKKGVDPKDIPSYSNYCSIVNQRSLTARGWASSTNSGEYGWILNTILTQAFFRGEIPTWICDIDRKRVEYVFTQHYRGLMEGKSVPNDDFHAREHIVIIDKDNGDILMKLRDWAPVGAVKGNINRLRALRFFMEYFVAPSEFGFNRPYDDVRYVDMHYDEKDVANGVSVSRIRGHYQSDLDEFKAYDVKKAETIKTIDTVAHGDPYVDEIAPWSNHAVFTVAVVLLISLWGLDKLGVWDFVAGLLS